MEDNSNCPRCGKRGYAALGSTYWDGKIQMFVQEYKCLHHGTFSNFSPWVRVESSAKKERHYTKKICSKFFDTCPECDFPAQEYKNKWGEIEYRCSNQDHMRLKNRKNAQLRYLMRRGLSRKEALIKIQGDEKYDIRKSLLK